MEELRRTIEELETRKIGDVVAIQKEFFKMTPKSGLKEPQYQSLARCVNGLKVQIQDEMSTHSFQIMDESYQISSKVEEKLNRK